MNPEEKILYILRNEPHKHKELFAVIEPDMISHALRKQIYSQYYYGKESELGATEVLELEKYSEAEKGFSPTNVESILKGLREEWTRGSGTEILNNINKRIQNGQDFNDLVDQLKAVQTKFDVKKRDWDSLLNDIIEKKSPQGKGFNTGFKFIDEYTMRLKRGHLWVIGGYTSAGKTAFSLSVIVNAVQDNARCCMLSFEMVDVDIWDRVITNMNIGSRAYDVAGDWKKNNKFEVVDNLENLRQLENYIIANHEKFDVFCIDFIQNVEADGKSEYEKETVKIRKLQNLARHYKVCIVALSQISNEGAKNKSDIMTFKGSGAIAAAADVAIELRKVSDESVLVAIRKNRHGWLQKQELDFIKGNFQK